MSAYEGWTNYATWHAVALITHNDAELNRDMHTLPVVAGALSDKVEHLRDRSRKVLARNMPKADQAQINWREIVE